MAGGVPDLTEVPEETWTVSAPEGFEPDIGVVPAGSGTLLLSVGPDTTLVDLETGADLWTRSADGDTMLYPLETIGSTDRYLGGSRDSAGPAGVSFELVDLTTGEDIATLTEPGEVSAGVVAIDVVGDSLFRRETDADAGTISIAAIDLDSGNIAWEETFDHPGDADDPGVIGLPTVMPAGDPASIRVAIPDGPGDYTLHHLSLADGASSGTSRLGPLPPDAFEPGPAPGIVASFAEDILLTQSRNDDGGTTVTGWSLADGTQVWSQESDAAALTQTDELLPRDQASALDGLTGVYTASRVDPDSELDDGQDIELMRLDPRTGDPIWDAPTVGAWAVTSHAPTARSDRGVLRLPAATQDYLMIQDAHPSGLGSWNSLDASSGQPLGSFEPSRMNSVTAGAHVAYTTRMEVVHESTVSAYDRAGDELWELDLGPVRRCSSRAPSSSLTRTPGRSAGTPEV